MRFYPLTVALALLASQLVAGPAHAVLGETLAAKQLTRTVKGLYAVSESVTDSIVVREYANGAGVVFAVAWEGPARPDLPSLLGRHYQSFAAAVANRPNANRRHDVNVGNSEMLVEMGAHLRSHHGRVVLTGLLPQGVSVDEIR